jgi:hypothetical protein
MRPESWTAATGGWPAGSSGGARGGMLWCFSDDGKRPRRHDSTSLSCRWRRLAPGGGIRDEGGGGGALAGGALRHRRWWQGEAHGTRAARVRRSSGTHLNRSADPKESRARTPRAAAAAPWRPRPLAEGRAQMGPYGPSAGPVGAGRA